MALAVYASLDDPRMPLGDVPAYARRVEAIGFAGLLVPEAVHDAFLTAALALEHTRRITVATSVALAFPRSPTVTAYAAWDLQAMSGGRFVLGLGSQVKGNVVGRFGMEWTPPVERMRDYVGAVRAVWRCWQTGAPLRYESPRYRLTRMQPFFNPGPIEHATIPLHLGAVNPGMMRLAGEIADGLMTHPTSSSPHVLREIVAPALWAGCADRGRDDVRIVASTFVATGASDDDVARERERIRQFLGFLYSTPQYRAALDLHGWRDLGLRLHELSRAGAWGDMAAAVTDEVFDALVPSGTYDVIGKTLRAWYDGLVYAVTLRLPEDARDDPALAALIAALAQP